MNFSVSFGRRVLVQLLTETRNNYGSPTFIYQKITIQRQKNFMNIYMHRIYHNIYANTRRAVKEEHNKPKYSNSEVQ